MIDTVEKPSTILRTQFPKQFVWGTATASYQIEGASALDGRTPSIWDTFSKTPSKVKNGDTGDVACDHYHLYSQDFDLMQNLGFNAYRFSTSWSRIMPNGRGQINPVGMAFYDRIVDELLARGIEPYVTLYHWDLPQILEDAGGWLNRDTADAFVEYTNAVTNALGDRLKNWTTLNEPWCSAYLGYGLGIHAPGKTDFAASLQATHHLLLAHGQAMPIIRQNVPEASAGIVLNPAPVYPATDSSEDAIAAHRADGFQNRWYFDPVFGQGYPEDLLELYGAYAPKITEGDLEIMAAPLDFIGVNYYSRTVVKAATIQDQARPDALLGYSHVQLPDVPRTFFDWEVYPQGLTDFLVRLQNQYNPKSILITENGASYFDTVNATGEINDTERTDYFKQHLQASLEAIAQGAKLNGYFAWSFLDNFEWAEGYEKRFGMTHVDFTTQKRTVKQSGNWFKTFLNQGR
jgi:beta-glucosidase